ncbi:hypothetical protein M408DRAFT_25389 [Serendipita vermifera MAFF 305830]|uniref:F-box domain-containing protein n=1 Tax=Serendipita vermifera MAFF 305830 TaxID=933852 RepID=A0A0C2XB55_SERVB|nr:hypothetical protein M408DRAFT_25389 [Serendipita vermifera MAFF 305830]
MESPKWSEHKHLEGNRHRDLAYIGRIVSAADRLPEELLVSVFRILVEPDSSSIGPLLLVSRYWHHVAVATPSMWSRIQSRPHSLEDVAKDIEYIQTAIKNSSNLPLDITIDLQNLEYKPSPEDNYLKGPPKLASQLHEDQEDNAEVLLFRLIDAFVGDDCINVTRLRSISVNNVHQKEFSFVISERTTHWLLKRLDGPTPLLESLSLHVHSVDLYFPRKGGPFQDLKALKHLIVDASGHLGYIKFKPETIQALSFRLWGTTRVLSQFTRLRSLSIVNWVDQDIWADHDISYDPDPELMFPLLDCLTLRLSRSPIDISNSTFSLPHKIRAPSLTTLRLLDAEAITVVGAANVYHHVHTLDLLSPTLEGMIDFIKLHLYKYTALVNLAVFPNSLNVVKDEIRALQGQAPTGLNSLYTIISDKEGMVVDGSIELPSWRPAKDYIYRKDDTFTGR